MAFVAEQLALSLTDESANAQSQGPLRPASPSVRRQLAAWGATPVFDAYWSFASARQQILMRRLAGQAPPWTDDEVLARHRFTNPYRFTDRVSQYLIRDVQYNQNWDARSLVIRTLFFKIFNRIDTWELVRSRLGELSQYTFSTQELAAALEDARQRGQRIYSAAYIVPNPPYGDRAKHVNHLRMLQTMLDDGTVDLLARADNLEHLYRLLIRVPSLGPFLAFQYAIDLNYTRITSSDEWDFVVAGPGARDGLRKCFSNLPKGAEEDAICWVATTQHEHFMRLGIEFPFVFGRSLRPIDCQNLFCEIDKFARVRFPDFAGRSGRTRIKQTYAAKPERAMPPLVLPPKWRTVPN